ncbi:component of SufBCD complex [Roseivivax sp.]
MDWHLTILEVIDMRSFSNLWFWIALAVMWSTASHWVLGVPFDMVGRAARRGGQAQTDLEDMVRVNVNRLLLIGHEAGLWITAIGTFLLAGLGVSGFWFDVEFAQALFLLGLPMSLVGLLSLRTAHILAAQGLSGAPLRRRLARHRIAVQAIGMVSIFVTALWGMYQNMVVGPFPG